MGPVIGSGLPKPWWFRVEDLGYQGFRMVLVLHEAGVLLGPWVLSLGLGCPTHGGLGLRI